jgi:hypothetical protein
MEYFEEAREMWLRLVPRRGRAATLQGELIRAVEKLRVEALANGNCNFGIMHVQLALLVRETLTSEQSFASEVRWQIGATVRGLLDAEAPALDDEPFDWLTDRIVEWARMHREPIPLPDSSLA